MLVICNIGYSSYEFLDVECDFTKEILRTNFNFYNITKISDEGLQFIRYDTEYCIDSDTYLSYLQIINSDILEIKVPNKNFIKSYGITSSDIISQIY